ncbi:MAG: GNAT family N-acetyltransferase [Rubrivivax sp.]|nr:GNAT family N-acetyltransferase [Rubrivivax sp.]
MTPSYAPHAPDTSDAPASAAGAITVRRVHGDEAEAMVAPLADVLLDCVEGGASVSFMWPLPRERALAFWRGVAEGVRRGERALLVAEDTAQGGRVVGTLQLVLALPENQPHRADVAKMLVHRGVRRRGVGALLLQALDDVARAERRDTLVLDTVTGGDAERLYARAGWTAVGSVPRYALMPQGGYCATTFFYKQL